MLVIEKGQAPPAPLSEVILGGRCAAFIGSGLSASEYPSWPELVSRLCQACGVGPIVNNASSEAELLEAAEQAKARDSVAYHGTLWGIFGGVIPHIPLPYMILLSLPFDCYLTHNFDRLLSMGAVLAARKCKVPPQAYPALDRKDLGGRSIHHLHGIVTEDQAPVDGQIVLARSDFDDAYAANSNLMNFLVSTLESEPLVFVGCRLREPVMSQVFKICKDHQLRRKKLIAVMGGAASGPPPRFILLKKPQLPDPLGKYDADRSEEQMVADEEYYRGMDIQPVWYGGGGPDHSDLQLALQRLADLPALRPNYGWQEEDV